MPRRRTALTAVAVLGFVLLLLWFTLGSQRVECTITVEFRGRTGSATASGASAADAEREAQTAACGPLTAGMDDRLACAATPPLRRDCRGLGG